MVDQFVKSDISSRSVAIQAGAALALVAVALGAMWELGVFDPRAAAADRPAACDAPKGTDSPEYPALCAALNRPDLPALLGLPNAHASTAHSGGGPITLPDGTTVDDPSAEVQVGSFDVRITDNHRVSVKGLTSAPDPSVRVTTVLAHPAMAYSDHTVAFSFDGSRSSTGTGGIARHLVVSKSARADDGTFELAVWSQDGATPNDQALYLIADKVLPTLTGWSDAP